MPHTERANPLDRLVVASDLSALSDIAITRALVIATQHDATVTVVHVCASTAEVADAERMLRERLERLGGADADVRVTVGPPFVEIIRTARELDAALIVTGAHGPHWRPLALTGSTAERVVRKGDRPVLVVRQRALGAYQRVVAAIDESPYAMEALRFSLEVFDQAEHRVVHGVKVLGTSKLRGATPSDLRKMEESAVDGAAAAIANALEGVWAGEPPVVRYGDPPEVVADYAVEWDADVVVVGTHGAGAIPYILLGSTAQRILRETPSDVMLVRPARMAFELP